MSPRARRPLTLRPGFSGEANQARRRHPGSSSGRARCVTTAPENAKPRLQATQRPQAPWLPTCCSHRDAPSPTSLRGPKTPGSPRPTIRSRARAPPATWAARPPPPCFTRAPRPGSGFACTRHRNLRHKALPTGTPRPLPRRSASSPASAGQPDLRAGAHDGCWASPRGSKAGPLEA